MTGVKAVRSGLEVMKEIYGVTRDMLANRKDEEYLIRGIDRRQELMDEYDLLASSQENLILEDELPSFQQMVKQIQQMDQEIMSVLEQFKNTAKTNVVNANRQQKVLGYVNQAMASSGTYMDFKK